MTLLPGKGEREGREGWDVMGGMGWDGAMGRGVERCGERVCSRSGRKESRDQMCECSYRTVLRTRTGR